MLYNIVRYTGKSKDAGTKAPKDINEICINRGYKEIEFINPRANEGGLIHKIYSYHVNVNNWSKLQKTVKSGDYVLYQHPMYFGTKFAEKYIPSIRKNNVKFIALIHDLESLRQLTGVKKADITSYKFGDLTLLKQFDYVIAHNDKMKEFIVQNGIDSSKIINLDLFDYLCNTPIDDRTLTYDVCIAGNLDPRKCGYIYKLASNNPDIKINLYGANYDENNTMKNIIYHGSFSPEEITGKLEGSFGIVWDGPEINECSGMPGNYLRYNNPHKASMYLAAGIPVITWSQAAISSFINSNRVGFTVNTLENLSNEIKKVDNNTYLDMCKNARQVGKRLREGYYFNRAINKIINL